MRTKAMTGICGALTAIAIGASSVWAVRLEAAETPLTEFGQKLLERYTGMLTELQAEISKAVPAVGEQKKAAYLKAREVEQAAVGKVKTAQQRLNKAQTAQALVDHAWEWIGSDEKNIATAQAKLEQTIKETEHNAARQELIRWQEHRDAGIRALRGRQEALVKAKREEPKLIRELNAAEEALAQTRDNILKALDGLDFGPLLASSSLDGKFAKYVVLIEATPRGLAEFAQQGKEQEVLVEALLADEELMIQMTVADGAKGGRYGRAMEIYTYIQKVSKKGGDSVLQRLALAVGLEHAVPVRRRNATGKTNAPKTVEPVNRYLHYEKAYLGGELDPGFNGLSVWDYRMVVNGYEPDEVLTWGRKMLRNYRPDHISNPDYHWRYVGLVRTDIPWGSQYNKYDLPELEFFQNILMNAGVCGRRAFFGRFILRAFGIPTTARASHKHAALCHWTPKGWVVNLGGGWGSGWVWGKGNKDLSFLAITQARENRKAFLQVKRAYWVGDVLGEKRTYGRHAAVPDFWNGVALRRQQTIIEEAEAAAREKRGEANESNVKYTTDTATLTEANRKIVFGRDGVITIPAAATSKPTENTGKIVFMPSNLGGKQLHYNLRGKAESFEYTFEAPRAGSYSLSSRVVCPSWGQILLVSANGAKEPTSIELPLTVGMWEKTRAVEISVVKGKNVVTFSRRGGDNLIRGLTIRDFTLTPVK